MRMSRSQLGKKHSVPFEQLNGLHCEQHTALELLEPRRVRPSERRHEEDIRLGDVQILISPGSFQRLGDSVQRNRHTPHLSKTITSVDIQSVGCESKDRFIRLHVELG